MWGCFDKTIMMIMSRALGFISKQTMAGVCDDVQRVSLAKHSDDSMFVVSVGGKTVVFPLVSPVLLACAAR